MTRFLFITSLLAGVLFANATTVSVPEGVTISYSEQVLDIHWEPISHAIGYNVYTRESNSERRRINSKPIKTRPHFAFIWEIIEGKRQRRVKGYEHHISVTALFAVDGDTVESAPSEELNNRYFEGYESILDAEQFKEMQPAMALQGAFPVRLANNSSRDFMKFLETGGRALIEEMRKNIDPREVGACAPISTIAVKLLAEQGIYAYKAEGTFIKEYHNFVVVRIDGSDFILDFTTDQFVPQSAPVVIPINRCFLKEGRIAESGRAIYQISKLYPPEGVKLSDSKESEIYQEIYQSVTKL